jgi:hypothetical protein
MTMIRWHPSACGSRHWPLLNWSVDPRRERCVPALREQSDVDLCEHWQRVQSVS